MTLKLSQHTLTYRQHTAAHDLQTFGGETLLNACCNDQFVKDPSISENVRSPNGISQITQSYSYRMRTMSSVCLARGVGRERGFRHSSLVTAPGS